jgi:sugar phosphate isomerase/epimerase
MLQKSRRMQCARYFHVLMLLIIFPDVYVKISRCICIMLEAKKKYDIRISSFHFAGITATNIGDSQTQIREHMRKSVEAFSPLEPNAFVIHAGWLQGADNTNVIETWQNIVHKHGEEALIEHIADNFKEMIKMLSDLGIYAAFETMGKFFPLGQRNNIEMLMEFIDEKNTGYCLDSGHIHACGGSVAEWIKLCGNRIFETHFHDNHARAANISGKSVSQPALPVLSMVERSEVEG